MICQDKIPTTELLIGMYVCKLDRPWLETSFPFQGFFIRSKCEIKELRGLCQYVYIDGKKGNCPYTQSEIGKPSPLLAKENNKRKNKIQVSKYQYTHVNIGKYDCKQTPFKKEIKKASKLMVDLSFSMDQLNFQLRTGQKIDIREINDITEGVVKSIIRNPNSLISLSRLQDKGEYTYNHSLRCCILAAAFGRYLGLSEEDLLIVSTGALFADIGKSKIPSKILNSRAELSNSEKLLLNSHVELGVEILGNNHDFEHGVLVVVETHHERYNGTGYPYGLVGDEIPLLGQIAALVDVFDAMTNKKSYGKQVHSADAMDWLFYQKSVLFSARLIDDFIQAIGLYPAGTKVQLTDNSKAIVISQNPDLRLRPVVYLIEDSLNNKLSKYKKVDLSKKSLFTKSPKPMIVKAIL